MILKALYDYYHRSGDDVAPFGLEYKEIGFIIVIDRCGKFLRFEDRRIDKKSAQRFLVKKSVSRSSALLQTICMTIVNMYLVIPIRGIWKRYVSTLKYLRQK